LPEKTDICFPSDSQIPVSMGQR